jgi:hypothetical protein
MHVGERVRSSANVLLPTTLPTTVERAELIIATPPGAPLIQRETVDLAPLTSNPGFRRLDPRRGRAGISAANRMRLYPRGSEALGLGVTLVGTESASLTFDAPKTARRLAVVSFLGSARNVMENEIVAELFVSDQGGGLWVFPIMAGRDTADIWHEYPPFAGQMRHGRAPIAWQESRTHQGHSFHNDVFHQTYDLGRVENIRSVKLRSLLQSPAAITVVDLVTIPE